MVLLRRCKLRVPSLTTSPITNKCPFRDAKIQQEPNNYLHYCDRSGLLARHQKFDSALADAKKAIKLKDDAICWVRKGAALKGLYHIGEGEMQSAHEAFDKALELDPSNSRAIAGSEATGRKFTCEKCKERDNLVIETGLGVRYVGSAGRERHRTQTTR